MPHRQIDSRWDFISTRRMFDDIRFVERSIRRRIRGTSYRAENERYDRDNGRNEDRSRTATWIHTESATLGQDRRNQAPATHIPIPGAATRPTNRGDDELVDLRTSELYRRLRILADDTYPWNLHLLPFDFVNRIHMLGCYRTTNFLSDLASGLHDGYTEALHNQEHDHYYSELRSYIEDVSESAASALDGLPDPHQPPLVALTIPPIYEPSDLPPYTASISPPTYSFEVPAEHVARDVPPCTAGDCPVRKLGIAHSCGLYHHEGQPGPVTFPQGTWLPSFGRSNPPQNVWDAYNFMVLGIARPHHHKKVAAFIRYHSRPWRPEYELPLPTTTQQTSNRREDMAKMLPSSQNQKKMGRIPRPQSPVPASEIENRVLEYRGLDAQVRREELVNDTYDHRQMPTIPTRINDDNDQHRLRDQLPQPHRRSTRRFGLSAVVPSVRIIQQGPMSAAQSPRTSRFSEYFDVSGNHQVLGSEVLRRPSIRERPIEANTGYIPYRPHYRRRHQRWFAPRIPRGSALSEEQGPVAAYFVPPFPAYRAPTNQPSNQRHSPSHEQRNITWSRTVNIRNQLPRLRTTSNVAPPPPPPNSPRGGPGSPYPVLSARPTNGMNGSHIATPATAFGEGLSYEDRLYYQRIAQFADTDDAALRAGGFAVRSGFGGSPRLEPFS